MTSRQRLSSILAVCTTVIVVSLLVGAGCGGPDGKKDNPSNQAPSGVPAGWDGKSDWNEGRWRAVDP